MTSIRGVLSKQLHFSLALADCQRREHTLQCFDDQSTSSLPSFLGQGGNDAFNGPLSSIKLVQRISSVKVEIHVAF